MRSRFYIFLFLSLVCIPAMLRAAPLTGKLEIQYVQCSLDSIAYRQTRIPLTVRLINRSEVDINIQYVYLVFTHLIDGDRNGDYNVHQINSPDPLISPQESRDYEFEIDVLPGALTDQVIDVGAFVIGERQDDLSTVTAASGDGHTILDRFETVSYGNNDGSRNWFGDWIELGDGGTDPSSGKIYIGAVPGFGINALIMGQETTYAGINIRREADLSEASEASLSLLYARDPDTGFSGDLIIQAAADGSSSWTDLDIIGGGSDPAAGALSYDISEFMTPTMMIRLFIEGPSNGKVYIDDVGITYRRGIETHSWTVLSTAITANITLFDTRMTPDRSDDSLLYDYTGEVLLLDRVHYFKDGDVLAAIPMDGSSIYRMVLQYVSLVEWEWEPKDALENGYIAFSDTALGFGRLSAPQPGRKEFLLSELMVGDEETDPADFVIGTTGNNEPPVPWGMMTDPWTDPLVDEGKTGEYGSVVEALTPPRWIIGCEDGGKNWEVTGKLEDDRYYFQEVWFRPDLEWVPGDIADIFLHLGGADGQLDMDELHARFRLVDDDSVGPVITDFYPEKESEGEQIIISCRINDPSGVYDDGTGSEGQGVYIRYDTDGSLVDDFFEIRMSSAGGDTFITDTPIPAQVIGTEIIYRAYACDYDTDTGIDDRACTVSAIHTVQIVGVVAVDDDPGTLSPSSVYPGQSGVVFHVDISSPNPAAILLNPALSYITFDDGIYYLSSNLANETILVSGAAGFPLAFDPIDFPADFSSPDTITARMHLEGIYDGIDPWDQTWDLSISNRLISMEPTLHIEAQAIPSPMVNPGQRKVELLRMEMTNLSLSSVILDSLVVSNVTSGHLDVPENDSDIEMIYLYRGLDGVTSRDVTEGTSEEGGPQLSRPFSKSDMLVAYAPLDGGTAVLRLTDGMSVPVSDPVYYYVVADFDSFMAADGDRVDLEISSPESFFLTGPVSVVPQEVPLNSEGDVTIDGFMSHQASVIDAVEDTIYSGFQDHPVLVIDLPANGYAPDILTGFSAANYGNPEVAPLIVDLKLWGDEGDGVFSAGTDIYIGTLVNTGGRFQISGLSRFVIGSQRFFLTARFGQDFSDELSVRFGIPVGGIEYISNNDGPLVSEIVSPKTQILIRRENVLFEAAGTGSEEQALRPGEEDAALLGLRVENNTLAPVRVDSLTLSGPPGLFECEPGKTIDLYLDNGDGSFDPGSDTYLSSGTWSAGSCPVASPGVGIAAGSEAVLFAATDIDILKSSDGDTLRLSIVSPGDIHLAAETVNPFETEGAFPIKGFDPPFIDGMISSQLSFYPAADSIISSLTDNILIMDIEIPGNGCRSDTLGGISIVNRGTATGEHIKRVLIWADDGDGYFDPAADDSLAVLAEAGGGRYEAYGLQEHLDGPGGGRFFITADLRSGFTTGASIIAAVPVMGIEVYSGNDGPADEEVRAANGIIIPVPDRVTFIASSLSNKTVHPGTSNILNMVLGAYNSYSEAKVLSSAVIFKTGTSRPDEISAVSAWADTDGNGMFDPDNDDLLETVESSGTIFNFENLDMALPPLRSSLIFFAYDIPLEGVRDSVSIDLSISDPSMLAFEDPNTIIEGEFPLGSAGVDMTDGMTVHQVALHPVSDARISPGDLEVPCFSFTVPCNGTESDELKSISIENSGTSLPGVDIEYLRLWKESGGDPQSFDPGMEEFLDFLVWNGGTWSNISSLSEVIDCGEGITLHVTADISSAANDDRTLLVFVPVNGIQVVSGNDGPVDAELRSPAEIIITTDPLIVSFCSLPPVTLGQQFDVTLSVENVADTAIMSIRPDSFSWSGTGDLTLVSGPDPAQFDLEGYADSLFTWTFTASSEGEVVLRAKVAEDGGGAASRLEISDTLTVCGVPDYINVTLDDLSPVSLNRGHEDATLMEMAVSYGSACEGCAIVEFYSLGLRFTDGSGVSRPVRDIATRVIIEDESRVLYSLDTSGLSDTLITLITGDHVHIGPGEIKTYRISLDIAGTAAASNFRIFVDSTDLLVIRDHNTYDQVVFGGVTFPWSTNTVTLKDPAVELVAGMEGMMPPFVNRGQQDVRAFRLILSNSAGTSGADISISRIWFELMETDAGDLAPGEVIEKFSLRDDQGLDYYVTSVFDPSGIECMFEPEVVVSPSIPLALNGYIDILADPLPDSFSVYLPDSLSISARDVNSGSVVEVMADTGGGFDFPMLSGTAGLVNSLSGFTVSGVGVLPEKVAAGADSVEALRFSVQHTGDSGESNAAVAGVTIRILDQAGHGIAPYTILDAVRLIEGANIISTVYPQAADTSSYIYLPVSGQLILAAGSSTEVRIEVDIEDSAMPGNFQFYSDNAGFEVVDDTSGDPFEDIEGDFPISSGLTEIVLPADRVVFGAQAELPPNITAGETVELFTFSLERGAGTGGSLVFLEELKLHLYDENDAALDMAGEIEEIRIESDEGNIPLTIDYPGEGALIGLAQSEGIDSGESVQFRLYIKVRQGGVVRSLWGCISAASDISCVDEATGDPVQVEAAPGTAFPFETGRSVLLGTSLEESFSNYPNPFVASRERTRITFFMPADGLVTLKIFTVMGRHVATLLENDSRSMGLHQDVWWDGRNGDRENVINGVYYLVLTTAIDGREQTVRRKVALVY